VFHPLVILVLALVD